MSIGYIYFFLVGEGGREGGGEGEGMGVEREGKLRADHFVGSVTVEPPPLLPRRIDVCVRAAQM